MFHVEPEKKLISANMLSHICISGRMVLLVLRIKSESRHLIHRKQENLYSHFFYFQKDFALFLLRRIMSNDAVLLPLMNSPISSIRFYTILFVF